MNELGLVWLEVGVYRVQNAAARVQVRMLRVGRKVEQADQRLAFVLTDHSEHRIVERIPRGHPSVRCEAGIVAHRAQILHALPQLVLQRTGLLAQSGLGPVELTTVQIAAVFHMIRVFHVIPAVELGDFVAAVEHRETSQEAHGVVHHQVTVYRGLQQWLVVRDDGLLDAAQAGGGAATAGVARGFVVVVEFAHRPAAGGCALVEALQEFLVLEQVDVEVTLHVFVQAPADVVMAA